MRGRRGRGRLELGSLGGWMKGGEVDVFYVGSMPGGESLSVEFTRFEC